MKDRLKYWFKKLGVYDEVRDLIYPYYNLGDENAIDWGFVCSYINLPTEFIEEFTDYIDWNCICKYQNLSEEFIHKNIKKLDRILIGRYQKISSELNESLLLDISTNLKCRSLEDNIKLLTRKGFKCGRYGFMGHIDISRNDYPCTIRPHKYGVCNRINRYISHYKISSLRKPANCIVRYEDIFGLYSYSTIISTNAFVFPENLSLFINSMAKCEFLENTINNTINDNE